MAFIGRIQIGLCGFIFLMGAGCDKPPTPTQQQQGASQGSRPETPTPIPPLTAGVEKAPAPQPPSTPAGPGDAVRKHFEAASRGKYSEAYGYLCAEDRGVVSLEAYVKESNDNAGLGQLFAAKTSYVVKSVKIDGDKAAVVLEVTRPDMSGLFRDLMAQSLAGKLDDPETKKKLAEKVASQELPLSTSEAVHNAVRDADGWKVHLGRAQRKQVETLIRQAEDLAKDGHLDDAMEKFKEVLAIDPDQKVAEMRIRSLAERAAEEKAKAERLKRDEERKREAAAYVPKVELRDIQLGKSRSGDPSMTGEVKNLGDRTINKLRVTMYFLDAAGKPVHEDYRLPVWLESQSFSGDSHYPLKPNYSRKLVAYFKDVPSDWAGKIDAKVTEIVLEDASQEKHLGSARAQRAGTPEAAAAKAKAAEAERLRAEEEAYLSKIELRDVQLTKPERGDPRVSYELKNLGDRTIGRLEVTVYYLDAAGKSISEKKDHPVRAGSFSSGDAAQPLKPNYTRKDKTYIDNAPSEWGGKVDVKVTRCEFLKGE